MKENDISAFPHATEIYHMVYYDEQGRVTGHTAEIIDGGGMTLRDYFAAKALQGFLADSLFRPDRNGNLSDFTKGVVKRCYEYADAMLKARGE